jgi:hypothetical protein
MLKIRKAQLSVLQEAQTRAFLSAVLARSPGATQEEAAAVVDGLREQGIKLQGDVLYLAPILLRAAKSPDQGLQLGAIRRLLAERLMSPRERISRVQDLLLFGDQQTPGAEP